MLTTGARTYCYFHSEGKQIPYLREMNPDPLIEINPQDAGEATAWPTASGCEVSNPFGTCVLKAKVSQIGHSRGVVHGPARLLVPREGRRRAARSTSVWRSNINELIPHKYIGELGFGAPFKCILCKRRSRLRKATTPT